jgi:hypothetical protein
VKLKTKCNPETGGDRESPWIVLCFGKQTEAPIGTPPERELMMKRLVTYDPMAQHTGTWLRGYNWNIYGCGTYRQPKSETHAVALMKRFVERLQLKLHAPVSFFAAMERRYSGCGDSPIPVHWHFLAASVSNEAMAPIAESLWEELFGNAKIDPYDRNRDAAHYVCKLVSHPNGSVLSGNLDQMEYQGPSDLLAAAQVNPYVPAHLKDRVSGQYLVIR